MCDNQNIYGGGVFHEGHFLRNSTFKVRSVHQHHKEMQI